MCFFDLVLRRPLSFGLILLEDFEKLPNVKVNEGQAEVCSLNSAASITSSRRSRGSFKVIWGVNFHRTGRAGWEGRGKVIPPMQLQILATNQISVQGQAKTKPTAQEKRLAFVSFQGARPARQSKRDPYNYTTRQ